MWTGGYTAFRWRHRLGLVGCWQRGLCLAFAAVLIGSPAAALMSAEQVQAQDDPLALANGQGDTAAFASISFLDNAELPPAIGQPEFSVYIEETGHTLGGVFLDYWRATGQDALFGAPISEPFAGPDGYYSQVFERGILQYLPSMVWTVEPFVRPMPVGRLLIGERSSGLGPFAGGKRLAAGSTSKAHCSRG